MADDDTDETDLTEDDIDIMMARGIRVMVIGVDSPPTSGFGYTLDQVIKANDEALLVLLDEPETRGTGWCAPSP